MILIIHIQSVENILIAILIGLTKNNEFNRNTKRLDNSKTKRSVC